MEHFLILARRLSRSAEALRRNLTACGRVEIVLDEPLVGWDTSEREGDFIDLTLNDSIYIPDSEAGRFQGMMSDPGRFPRITAWSRAFAHIAATSNLADGFWFVEDDVAGDQASFRELVKLTTDERPDLAVPCIWSKDYDPEWPWWWQAEGYFTMPLAAFQPLCRVSARLIECVLDFQKAHGKLTFHEILFASLALENRMLCLDWSQSAQCRRLFGAFRPAPEVDVCGPGISHPVKSPCIHTAICSQPIL